MFNAIVKLMILEIFATSVTPYSTVYVHNSLGQPASGSVGMVAGDQIVVPVMYVPRYQQVAVQPIQIQIQQQTPAPTTKKPKKGLWKKMKLAFAKKAEKLGKKAQKLGKNMQKEKEE